MVNNAERALVGVKCGRRWEWADIVLARKQNQKWSFLSHFYFFVCIVVVMQKRLKTTALVQPYTSQVTPAQDTQDCISHSGWSCHKVCLRGVCGGEWQADGGCPALWICPYATFPTHWVPCCCSSLLLPLGALQVCDRKIGFPPPVSAPLMLFVKWLAERMVRVENFHSWDSPSKPLHKKWQWNWSWKIKIVRHKFDNGEGNSERVLAQVGVEFGVDAGGLA